MVVVRIRRLVAAVVVVPVLFSACGDDGSASDSVPEHGDSGHSGTVEMLTRFFQESGADDAHALQFDEDGAQCMARGVLEELGEERLEELGLDVAAGRGPTLASPPLEPDEADRVYELTGRCVDLIGQTAALFEESGLATEEANCVAVEYARSGVLAEALSSEEFDPELNQRIDDAIDAAMAACGVEGAFSPT